MSKFFSIEIINLLKLNLLLKVPKYSSIKVIVWNDKSQKLDVNNVQTDTIQKFQLKNYILLVKQLLLLI